MTTTPDLFLDVLHGFTGPHQIMGLNGGIDNPFQFRTEPPVALLRARQLAYETRGLCRGGVSRNESSYRALGQPERLCRCLHSPGHWSIALQRILNDPFTLLRFGPVKLIDDAEVLNALIELSDRERRQSSQFGDGNFSKISGAGFLNPRADAFQAFQPMYAALPQHQFPGSQLQAKGRIGRRCGREPPPRIWTRNADNVRFWTENTEMFSTAFAAVRFFGLAVNRQTSRLRSGAYAHSRKLHRLSRK